MGLFDRFLKKGKEEMMPAAEASAEVVAKDAEQAAKMDKDAEEESGKEEEPETPGWDAITDAFEKLYNDYSYLDSKYKPMPHKNSVVEYKATSNQIVNQMGVDFTNAISSVAQKSDQLQTELNASQQALINEQKWFESCLEGILSFANTNAIVLKANAQDDIQIYVAKKARYLVKDEDGVGAELRLQKPIKGRIYKSLEKEGAFNFVPNPDKEGNPVEVDLSIIFSGTAVKVLSK